jgi:hypothetical protein
MAAGLMVACQGGDKELRSGGGAEDTRQEDQATPPADWREFRFDGLSISLPQSFEGGVLRDDDTTLETIADLGEGCAASAELVASFESLLRFFAVDGDQCEGDRFVTNVNVTREAAPGGIDIEQYLEALINFLPRSFEITEQEVVDVGGRAAGMIRTHAETGGAEFRQVIWAFPVGDAFWVVTFSTPVDEFDNRLQDFQRSALTFESSLPED